MLVFNELNTKKLGLVLFLIGIFFLSSSLFISILFILPAAVIGSIAFERNYLKDNWNISFFTCGILIFIITLCQKFLLSNNFENVWNPNLSILGMANWLPFFWFFWAFQPYLNTKKLRKLFALILISGTFPVLLSGFGQYFFGWTGPFEILNGLIIWYQRPIEEPAGLSGLFNHQNYAGSWLNFVWPFCIALIFEKSKNYFKNSVSILFFISVASAAFLTNSRNTWGGLLISIPLVLGIESFIWLIPIMVLIFFILFISISNIFSGNIQDLIRNIIPQKIWMEFSPEGFKDLDVSRLQIFYSAFKIMLLRPFVGVGAASFTAIYELQNNFWKGHSHNLIIELGISYGIPVALILFFTISKLLYLSCLEIFKNNKHIEYFERAWWASIFFFLISQLVDIQYFDAKISIIFWSLLAGLRNVIKKNIGSSNLGEFI